jgi:hypothetical protein
VQSLVQAMANVAQPTTACPEEILQLIGAAWQTPEM